MQFFNALTEVPDDFGPSAVTIGKFNGIHLGHLAMIRETLDAASRIKGTSVVVTFDRHPSSLLTPDRVPTDITGPQRRLELIESTGVAATLILPFTPELAQLSPDEFVSAILVERLHAQVLIVGKDFRFGHGAAGTVATLRELGEKYGFSVTVIEDVCPDGQQRVSSSWVRELLDTGDVAEANQLLGRRHGMRGEIVHGDARGRELGYPTANLSHQATGLMPGDGMYAGWLVDEDGTRYPVAISIGTNPTFEGERRRRVEAHVIDATLDLYGHDVVIEFVQFLRPQLKFDAIEPLIAQMDDDIVQIRKMLQLG